MSRDAVRAWTVSNQFMIPHPSPTADSELWSNRPVPPASQSEPGCDRLRRYGPAIGGFRPTGRKRTAASDCGRQGALVTGRSLVLVKWVMTRTVIIRLQLQSRVGFSSSLPVWWKARRRNGQRPVRRRGGRDRQWPGPGARRGGPGQTAMIVRPPVHLAVESWCQGR